MPIGDQVPRGDDDVIRRVSKLEALYNQVIGLAGSAKAIAAAVQAGLGALAASGTTWAGPVASPSSVTAVSDFNTSAGFLISPAGRAFTTVTGFASAYFDGTGKLGINTSSQRYKENICALVYDNAPLYAAEVVEYDRIGGGHEIGFIAEQFVEIGLGEFVFNNAEGEVEGILYEKISIALVAVVQEQKRQLDALEQRLDAAGL